MTRLICETCEGRGWILGPHVPQVKHIRDMIKANIPLGDKACWVKCISCNGIGSYEEIDGEVEKND